jgi:hypothetical protein
VSVLSGRRVEVRGPNVTWTGKVVVHDCAGIMLLDPVPNRSGAGSMFIPWDKVQWVDVIDMPRGQSREPAA